MTVLAALLVIAGGLLALVALALLALFTFGAEAALIVLIAGGVLCMSYGEDTTKAVTVTCQNTKE